MQGSSSGGERSPAGCESLPVRYPYLHDNTTYLRQYQTYFNTARFYRSPGMRWSSHSGRVSVILRQGCGGKLEMTGREGVLPRLALTSGLSGDRRTVCPVLGTERLSKGAGDFAY